MLANAVSGGAAISRRKLPRLSEGLPLFEYLDPTESRKTACGHGLDSRWRLHSRLSDQFLNGECWRVKGAIFITINYRLGIFGFFAHPELSAESAHHASEIMRYWTRSRHCMGAEKHWRRSAAILIG